MPDPTQPKHRRKVFVVADPRRDPTSLAGCVGTCNPQVGFSTQVCPTHTPIAYTHIAASHRGRASHA